MSNIISINKSTEGLNVNVLSAYIDAQYNQRIPEEVFFVAGAILTVVLPELFFSIYGGLIPFFVFASSLIGGVGLGLAKYNDKSPYQTLSLSNQTVSQVQPRKENTRKEAA